MSDIYATHNRAGEITFVQTGELTVVATVTTYTKASSDQADRDTLTILWGDGTETRIGRQNGGGNGQILPGDIKFNVYVGTHTYPGRSTYTMSVEDPNRIGNILNINNANSIAVRFYIETTITFLNPQFQGFNTSAVLLQRPIDEACVNQRFVHLPNAYDADDDSLSFELITPLASMGEPVPDYVLPNAVNPGPNNQIFFNTSNGEFIWDSPQRPGEYNIAIRINEFRNGVLINSIIRDMQINVQECDNRPPVILTDDLICVVAGEQILRDITVTDPDASQLVRLEGSGGPFLLPQSPATLSVASGYQPNPLTGRFEWNTVCNHISKTNYSVVFKGEDNFFIDFIDTTGLVDLHELRIQVSGPAPQGFNADSESGAIRLLWNNPYACEVTENEFFRGFTVWRKLVPTDVPIDTCGTDLEEFGYRPIAFEVRSTLDDRYSYLDEDVERGITYCYRVTAEFAQISPAGNPFNRVQSLPTDEICLQVSRDLPLITHVTVDETSTSTGQITVRWVAPLPEDLDTMENPPPYRYNLLRSPGIGTNSFTQIPGAVFQANSFSELINFNEFIDQNLNTVVQGYTYAIDFYSSDLNNAFGQSQSASSVFLGVIGTDRRTQLSWIYDVPWFVENHEIFRENITSGVFELIGDTEELNFDDFPVENNVEYCYYIKTIGSYGLRDIADPLENLSQIACAIPIDSVPPCTPQLSVLNSCSEEIGEVPNDETNLLVWNFDNGNCMDSSDIAFTEIIFISDNSGDTSLLALLEGPDIRRFEHVVESDDRGCYLIRTIDLNNNTSPFTTIVCPEVCPDYMLPNVFTPNGDGSNDMFVPFPYRFITRIDIKIFTRWGNLVFETNNPDINWDGNDLNGNELKEDVYFYTCRVFSGSMLQGFEERELLKGNITLIRE